MLISLLLLAQAATAAAPPSPEAASDRAGEAYGFCLASAARDASLTTGDMDAIWARALAACAAEGEAVKRSFLAYLRSVGAEMSDADYERMLAESMPRIRQRIAGCIEADRLNRADGGRRMC